MIKILFVCHGNICRSPMAEYTLKSLVARRGLSHRFRIDSAATSAEEIGEPVYPPARRKLAEQGISCHGHAARQLERRDYERWDCLIGMDEANRRNMTRLFRGDPQGKITLLLDWTPHPRSVADPWYTDDFDAAWLDISTGCQALLDQLLKQQHP